MVNQGPHPGKENMNEVAISIIRKYIRTHNYNPKSNIRKDCFEQVSYSSWAANQLLLEVMARPLTPPDTIIEEFAWRMDYYSCINVKTSRIFSIAKDTAEDILYLFL